MSLNALRKGQRIKAGASEFLILQRLPDSRWQLQNSATGEWCTFTEDDLLDRFARGEISLIAEAKACGPTGGLAAKLTRDLAAYPPELVALGRKREQLEVNQVARVVMAGPYAGALLFQTGCRETPDDSRPSLRPRFAKPMADSLFSLAPVRP